MSLQWQSMLRLLAVAGVFCVAAFLAFWLALVNTVHRGTLTVPDLRGSSLEDAEQRAHDLGLVLEADEAGVFSAEVEPGQIAAQQPHPGYHVKTGAALRVRLSLGRERVAVPDLSGQSLQAAQQVLERVGLLVGERARVRGQLASEGVIATGPAAGAEVAPRSEVALLVNTGAEPRLWVMPTLLRRSLEAVQAFCGANHIRLGQVHEVPYPGLGPGVVLRQYPAAGSQLSRSDIVTLWVSR